MRMRTPFHRLAGIGGLARSVGMWSIWVLVGVFLWWLPGRFPPPAWMALWTWLHAQEPVPPISLLVGCGQAAALALSWLGWVGIALWLVRRRSFMHTIVSWPQDGMSTVRPSEGPRSQQEAIPSSMILQERQELREHFSDHAVQKGVASRQPPHKKGSVQLMTLLTASSTGVGAAMPLHAYAHAPACAPRGGRTEATCDLAIGGWCQTSLSQLEPGAEDSLLVVAGEADLRENGHGVPLGLIALTDGVSIPDQSASTGRLALTALVECLLPDLATLTDPQEQEITATLHTGLAHVHAQLQRQWAVPPSAAREGTALVAALLLDRTAYLTSIGHCRAYVYQESTGLVQITTDHAVSMPEQRDVERGSLTAQPPSARGLYRSLEEEASPGGADHFTVPLREGDLLLLCTDGCWREVQPDLFAEVVAGCARRLPADPFRLSAILHEQVLSCGGPDAASLITVAVLPTRHTGDLSEALAAGGKRRRSIRQTGRHTGRKTRTREGAMV